MCFKAHPEVFAFSVLAGTMSLLPEKQSDTLDHLKNCAPLHGQAAPIFVRKI